MPETSSSLLKIAAWLGAASIAIGQQVPTVTQTAKGSACANIVALAGAKIDCSSLTPSQKKALASIPAILKMTLTNDSYLEEILKKLDEIQRTTSSTTLNSAPNGFAISGGSLDHPVINNTYSSPAPIPIDPDIKLLNEAETAYNGVQNWLTGSIREREQNLKWHLNNSPQDAAEQEEITRWINDSWWKATKPFYQKNWAPDLIRLKKELNAAYPETAMVHETGGDWTNPQSSGEIVGFIDSFKESYEIYKIYMRMKNKLTDPPSTSEEIIMIQHPDWFQPQH